MDEDKAPEEESTPENTGERSEPKATDLIGGANAAAERLEKANTKMEELIGRQEEVAAKQRLAGEAEAGTPSEKKEEISPKEYAKKALANDLDLE